MILVFGSNIVDIYFDLESFPEADCAVHLDTHMLKPGGKGANQAIAAARAGAAVTFVGALGDDVHGLFLLNSLQASGVDITHSQTVVEPTGLASIFVDPADGTHRAIVSQGANLRASQDRVPDEVIAAINTLVVQGELQLAETEALIKRAKACGAKAILNLAPYQRLSFEAIRLVDVLIMNEHELRAFAADYMTFADTLEALLRELHRAHGLTIVATLGGDGAAYIDKTGYYRVQPMKVEVRDTLGAGDAFVGFLVASLDRGDSLEQAVNAAIVASALTCIDFGAQVALPSLHELDQGVRDLRPE